jgi:hypothetical protein
MQRELVQRVAQCNAGCLIPRYQESEGLSHKIISVYFWKSMYMPLSYRLCVELALDCAVTHFDATKLMSVFALLTFYHVNSHVRNYMYDTMLSRSVPWTLSWASWTKFTPLHWIYFELFISTLHCNSVALTLALSVFCNCSKY